MLGRFLSADTVIPSPGNLQSYNRYSYVHNNPLSYVDPTGHFLVSLFKGVSNFVKKYWKTIAVIALSVVTAGMAAWALVGSFSAGLGMGTAVVGFWQGVAIGAIAGFAGGFAGGLLNGASLGGAFKAGLYGAASGAAAGAIGGAFDIQSVKDALGSFIEVARAAAHGLSGGILSDMQGGTFFSGFAAAGAASFAGHVGPQPKGYLSGLIKAAVVGGVASRIGGGKFENGAVSGAFTFMFNSALHEAERLQFEEGHRVLEERFNEYMGPLRLTLQTSKD